MTTITPEEGKKDTAKTLCRGIGTLCEIIDAKDIQLKAVQAKALIWKEKLEAAERRAVQMEQERDRLASMLNKLPSEQVCEICPHKNDKHSMNCIECCPKARTGRKIGAEL